MEIQLPKAFKELWVPSRYKVYYGGRGSTKSWSFARTLLLKGAERPLRILCVREVQKSIKDSVHKLLSDQIQALGLGAQYEVLQTEIRGRNGTEFIFSGLSTQTAESIKSFEGIDICWVEEAHAVSDSSWAILIPTIRKEGSEIWVSFNTNLKHDPTYQRFVVNRPEGAIVKKVSYRDNPWLTQVLKDEMAHLKAIDLEAYQHVWEGELRAIAEGAIFGKQLVKAREEGRICSVPVEGMVVVNTFWDLGRNDANSIWFHQQVGREHRFIDYYENRLQDLEHYVRVIRERGYLYGTHYLPHDADAKFLGMPMTRKQQLESAQIKPIEVVPRIENLNEGIEMLRKVFGQCWFDERKCEQGLEALANYAWKLDEDTGLPTSMVYPKWATNGTDALRQFAQGYVTPNAKFRPPAEVRFA